jgi:hypothetical protein
MMATSERPKRLSERLRVVMVVLLSSTRDSRWKSSEERSVFTRTTALSDSKLLSKGETVSVCINDREEEDDSDDSDIEANDDEEDSNTESSLARVGIESLLSDSRLCRANARRSADERRLAIAEETGLKVTFLSVATRDSELCEGEPLDR